MFRCHAMWGMLLVSLAGVAFAGEEGGANSADFSVAMMLLATVTFMMSTFYLVNMEDTDLKQAAWMVISSTISIFAAVLLFQAVNETVAYYILGQREGIEADPDLKLIVNFTHAALWYLGLQVVLAHISQAVTLKELKDMCHKRPHDEEEEEEESEGLDEDAESGEENGEEGDKQSEDAENLEKSEDTIVEEAELLMKCWATLFGHITGFACINAFGTLQGRMAGERALSTDHLQDDGVAGWSAFAAVVIAIVVLKVIFVIFDHFREWVALADDGEKDKMEELWDTETEETEDDVLGLTISFTTVNVFRYMVVGVLPNEEGEIECEEGEVHRLPCPPQYNSSMAMKLMLMGCAVFAAHVARTQLLKNDAITRNFGRLKEQFKVICGMIFAWTFFFGTHQIVALMLETVHMDVGEGTISAVCLAMLISFLGYVMIFALDKLADADWTDADIDKSIRELIKALGILIGFAWEKSFDAAVVSVASKVGKSQGIPPPVTKLVLSILICMTVIPAWLWYILPTCQELGCFSEEDEEEKEAENNEDTDEEKQTEKGTAEKETSNLNTPLLSQANENRKKLKEAQQAEKERMRKLKDIQKEIQQNSKQATKITQDIQQALSEFQKIKAKVECAK